MLAGCGGEEARQPEPRLPADLAGRLAADADAVAARLEAGDPCGAAGLAVALQRRTIAALNRRGAVPDVYKDDLGAGVADVVDRAQTACSAATPPPGPPPPPPPVAPAPNDADDDGDEERAEDQGENGEGTGKGNDKDKRKDKEKDKDKKEKDDE